MNSTLNNSAYRYFGDGRLQFVKRLFRQWHHQLVDFEERLWDDLPYWYSERTNIGILAAAALRLKSVVALEEYPIRRGNKPGRADLGLYDERFQRSYSFEFKFCYSALGWSVTKRIKAAMSAAGSDIRSLPKPPAGSQSIAITFVAPYLKRTPPMAEWNSLWMLRDMTKRGNLDRLLISPPAGAPFAWPRRPGVGSCPRRS